MIFNAEKRSSVCKEKEEEIGKGLGRSPILVNESNIEQQGLAVYFCGKESRTEWGLFPLLM